MKTIIRSLALLLLSGPFLSAQSTESPQYAYRILMNYIQDKERHAGDPRAASGFILGLGVIAEAGAAATWFAGDELAIRGWGRPLEPNVKLGVTVGLGGLGAILLGTGMLIQNAKPYDYRAQFSDVLSAPDPVSQNRLAAVSLWKLSEEAKAKRLSSAWSGILTPVLTSALTIALNLGTNKPWSDNLLAVNSGQILGIVGGFTQLNTPSEEEFLYLKYQATMNAAADFAVGTPVR